MMSGNRGSRASVTTKRCKKSKNPRVQQPQFVKAEVSNQNVRNHMEVYRDILREMGSIKKRVDNVNDYMYYWIEFFCNFVCIGLK